MADGYLAAYRVATAPVRRPPVADARHWEQYAAS
jgi:hypothetical protein